MKRKRSTVPEGLIKLMYSIAWSFHRTTGVPWEELLSEAFLAYSITMDKYFDKDKGKESVYLYQAVTSHLITFCKKEKRRKDWEIITEDLSEFSHLPTFIKWLELESSLTVSKDLKQILDLVLNHTQELACMTSKGARGFLYKQLRTQGWAWSRIWAAFTSMKSFLKESTNIL